MILLEQKSGWCNAIHNSEQTFSPRKSLLRQPAPARSIPTIALTRYSAITLLLLTAGLAAAQTSASNPPPSLDEVRRQLDRLADAVARDEVELKSSREEIQSLRGQVLALQGQLAGTETPPVAKPRQQPGEEAALRLKAEMEQLREEQDLQQGEIATQEQAKVESESKFPVKLTGLILLSGFVNPSGVDAVQAPIVATAGPGTTGLSLSQTVLGLDARGPHLFGGRSAADVRMDFSAGTGQGSYSGSFGIARLRTAHAELAWDRTRAFVELDRPILNPSAPASLTAIAQPALAWSGNLWNWMPQVGGEHMLRLSDAANIEVQAAIADVPDPFAPSGSAVVPPATASLSEQSRWPGTEARIGYLRGEEPTGLKFGVGGYFSPHAESGVFHFDSWAATIDYRVPLLARLEASGSFYRGLGLGGLGGGNFKDYTYMKRGADYYYRPLDDVGGWAQLKARASGRIEFNATYGIDNTFAGQLRPYVTSASSFYQNLARNSTFFTNGIYSPTAYTLFSLEYRRIDSSPAVGRHSIADVYGVAAGYRF
jgi:hypothetical protein